MALKTLKTLVLKTATVAGVKLVTPADRIGLGLGTASATAYPTDNLSPGQIPLPPNPEPERARSRQELSAMQMRKQMPAATLAVPPGGPLGATGCFRSPGLSADRSTSTSASSVRSWQPATRTTASGRSFTGCRFAELSRVHVPGDLCHSVDDRLGRDCQSPDRSTGKQVAKLFTQREVVSAAAAGK